VSDPIKGWIAVDAADAARMPSANKSYAAGLSPEMITRSGPRTSAMEPMAVPMTLPMASPTHA
jgi:hypothetical protein